MERYTKEKLKRGDPVVGSAAGNEVRSDQSAVAVADTGLALCLRTPRKSSHWTVYRNYGSVWFVPAIQGTIVLFVAQTRVARVYC